MMGVMPTRGDRASRQTLPGVKSRRHRRQSAVLSFSCAFGSPRSTRIFCASRNFFSLLICLQPFPSFVSASLPNATLHAEATSESISSCDIVGLNFLPRLVKVSSEGYFIFFRSVALTWVCPEKTRKYLSSSVEFRKQASPLATCASSPCFLKC